MGLVKCVCAVVFSACMICQPLLSVGNRSRSFTATQQGRGPLAWVRKCFQQGRLQERQPQQSTLEDQNSGDLEVQSSYTLAIQSSRNQVTTLPIHRRKFQFDREDVRAQLVRYGLKEFDDTVGLSAKWPQCGTGNDVLLAVTSNTMHKRDAIKLLTLYEIERRKVQAIQATLNPGDAADLVFWGRKTGYISDHLLSNPDKQRTSRSNNSAARRFSKRLGNVFDSDAEDQQGDTTQVSYKRSSSSSNAAARWIQRLQFSNAVSSADEQEHHDEHVQSGQQRDEAKSSTERSLYYSGYLSSAGNLPQGHQIGGAQQRLKENPLSHSAASQLSKSVDMPTTCGLEHEQDQLVETQHDQSGRSRSTTAIRRLSQSLNPKHIFDSDRDDTER